jgi:hypothetical protein
MQERKFLGSLKSGPLKTGIARHFDELENEIEKSPTAGTQELMANTGGRATPVRTMSTQTEIFAGVVSYSKELIAVYVCSDDMTAIRFLAEIV